MKKIGISQAFNIIADAFCKPIMYDGRYCAKIQNITGFVGSSVSICHTIIILHTYLMITDRTRDRMLAMIHRESKTARTTNMNCPYFFPITKHGAKKRAELCRRLACKFMKARV